VRAGETQLPVAPRQTGIVLLARAAVIALAIAAAVNVAQTPPGSPGALTVGDGERLLVIAPHPDDETLGAGGLIQRVLAQRGSVHVVLLTAGDGNVGGVVLETGLRQPPAASFVAYGERRVEEARAALRVLRAPAERLDVLGFPDGGLMPLLTLHWRRGHPEHSPTTGASAPPYPFALTRELAYDGADLRDELVRVLGEQRPTLIALPDPLDRHPDHRAGGIFTLLALDEWIGDHWQQAPRVLTYIVHWPAWPPGWDAVTPVSGDQQRPLVLPSTLPARPLVGASLSLTPKEVAAKAAALAAHTSQQRAMAAFLAAFVRRSEPFTIFDASEIGAVASEYRHPSKQEARRVGPPAAGGVARGVLGGKS
jgi:LmbE family N-acetylglucosaminyl deacetylase